MSDKLNPSDVDKALADLQAKANAPEAGNLEKGMTVDKRAMGGDTTKEEDPSTDKGRELKNVKNPEVGRIPASKKSGNFANDWKSAKGLENAAKEDGVHKNPEPNRGLSKAVEASASSSKKSASASSSKKVEKAVEASASSSKKMEKNYSASSMAKAVVPAEESASASGSASGASALNVKKSVDFIESAHKHLTKAFEDGSEADLDKAGRRLLSAKKEILKALEGGAKVNDRMVSKLNKAADYFCKSLETYENDDQNGHVHAVNRARRNMEKAIEAGRSFEKSLEADKALNFVKKDGKVILEMDEKQYREVKKSLVGSNLVKSVENQISEDARKTIDAVPVIKELFKSLTESNDSLREAIQDKSNGDREFKKSVADTVTLLGSQVKELSGKLDGIENKSTGRKSVVSVVESPLAKSVDGDGISAEMGRDRIGLILEKGLDAKLVDVKTYLAWDVDKDIPEEHAKYVSLCKSIEARLK